MPKLQTFANSGLAVADGAQQLAGLHLPHLHGLPRGNNGFRAKGLRAEGLRVEVLRV